MLPETQTVFAVTGMTCPSCVTHITKALGALEGVRHVEVRLKEGTVRVNHEASKVNTQALAASLREAGYDGRVLP